MVSSSIALGLLLDQIILWAEVDIAAQLAESSHLLPHWVEQLAALILVLLSVRALILRR